MPERYGKADHGQLFLKAYTEHPKIGPRKNERMTDE